MQLTFPVAGSLAVSAAYAKGNSSVTHRTKPYILNSNENVVSVADKYKLTVSELKELNKFRTFANGFTNVKAGDEIDVPDMANKFTPVADASIDKDKAVAEYVAGAGRFLDSNPDSDSAKNLVANAVSGKATAEVESWLSSAGNARIKLNTDSDFSIDNSEFDFLYPFYDSKELVAFSQTGIRRVNDRTQMNVGVGLRHFTAEAMVGGNLFYDYDISRGHSRAGAGVEYWRDYIKLGANAYVGLSGWKDSPDQEDYEERPANGWDVRVEGYLPAHPQLGGKLTYEKYYGDEVALSNDSSDRQKDPSAVTVGVNYTPFPLLTLSAEHRDVQGSSSEFLVGLEATFELGKSLRSQLDPAGVATARSLMGSRYDLVERNNNIVLEYRKKEVIQLRAVDLIIGKAGEKKSMGVSVNATHGVREVNWSAAELISRGGHIVHEGNHQYSVVLPSYQYGKNNNFYVYGVAYDNKGNASEQEAVQVSVLPAEVSVANSAFMPKESLLSADGASTVTLTLTLKDAGNAPIVGLADKITLQKTSANNAAIALITSDFTEVSPGVYQTMVTAGRSQESVILTPVVEGVTLGAAKVIVSGTPLVSDLTISGTLQVGQALSGQYAFNANGGEKTDKSLYQWGYQGETAASVASAGKAVTTSGQVSARSLVTSDSGKILELSVQAKNGAGVTGNTLTVDSTMESGEGNGTDGGNGGVVIQPNAAPQVADLKVTGTLSVGETLNGSYSFNANGGEPTDKSLFLWGYQGATASGVAASGATIAASGQVAGRQLTSTDAGKVMELSVQAKNGASVVGNTLTVNTTMESGEGNGTDGGDEGSVTETANAPSISDLALTGIMSAGATLSGSYTFNANGGEPTDKSLFLWGYQGETAATVASTGSAVVLSGQVGSRLLALSDVGKVMELSVQAKNAAGVTGNILTATRSVNVVNPVAEPLIENLAINGALEVGATLAGSYAFNANGGEPTDKSVFLWGYQGETSAAVAGTGSTITTSGEVGSRVLSAADVGKLIELSVQAKNGTGVTGNIATVNTSGSVINLTAQPIITDLTINGVLEMGTTLDGRYVFNANNGEPTDKSLFLWGYQGETAGVVAATGSAVTTSGQTGGRALIEADAGKVMELSVQAKNGAGVIGNTLTEIASAQVINPAAQPVVENLAISGSLEIGEMLSGSYNFNANGGEPTDKSLFLWGHQGETASAVAGSGTAIVTSGATGTHNLTVADVGNIMELSVHAKNGAGVTGNTLTVTAISNVINPNNQPIVQDLVITGRLEVSGTLDATYVFNANGGESTDKSRFLWGHLNDTEASVSGSGQEVTTSGEVESRPLLSADIGKVMEVSVQARNGAGIIGNTLTVSSVTGNTGGNSTEGGLTGGMVDPLATIVNMVVAANNALANNQAQNAVDIEVQDGLGAPLTNFPVNFSANNEAVLESGRVILDAAGHASVKLTNTVAGTTVVSATVATSAVKNVDTVFDANMTGVNVNGHTFATGEGFPTTGGAGRSFIIEINGTNVFNDKYVWSTNTSGATVSAAGVVTLQDDSIRNTEVTVMAKSPDGLISREYKFTVNRWFTQNQSPVTHAQAIAYCDSLGYSLVNISDMTNATPTGGTGNNQSRVIGHIWSEWGDISNTGSNYTWTTNLYGGDPVMYHTVSVVNGSIDIDSETNKRGSVCIKN